MVAPSPPGWNVPTSTAAGLSFVSSIQGTSALSSQALEMDSTATPKPIIIPDNSPGDISEVQLTTSAILNIDFNLNETTAGLIYGFQDTDNYIAVEVILDANGAKMDLIISEKINGTVSEVVREASDGPDPENSWVDLRFRVSRPDSSSTVFTAEAASHGGSYSYPTEITVDDSQIAFTSGDVGLTCGHAKADRPIAFDGDPVGSGGRPIRMYWP